MSQNDRHEYDDKVYDELMQEANKDERIGDHIFMVTKVDHGAWPSGDPRYKIQGVLRSCRDAKADLTWSPPPPPEVVEKEKAKWDRAKKFNVSTANTIRKQLAEHYGGKKVEQIEIGEQYAVKTNKSKVDEFGKGGFIRVIAFLPKDRVKYDPNSDEIPF